MWQRWQRYRRLAKVRRELRRTLNHLEGRRLEVRIPILPLAVLGLLIYLAVR